MCGTSLPDRPPAAPLPPGRDRTPSGPPLSGPRSGWPPPRIDRRMERASPDAMRDPGFRWVRDARSLEPAGAGEGLGSDAIALAPFALASVPTRERDRARDRSDASPPGFGKAEPGWLRQRVSPPRMEGRRGEVYLQGADSRHGGYVGSRSRGGLSRQTARAHVPRGGSASERARADLGRRWARVGRAGRRRYEGRLAMRGRRSGYRTADAWPRWGRRAGSASAGVAMSAAREGGAAVAQFAGSGAEEVRI